MKIIFAQGNPEIKYSQTRHNIGFSLTDAFAADHDTTFQEKTKFFAFIAETSINGEKVLLVKPTTYYNETGRSARALVDFYKIDPQTDLLVVHDDLALPFGTLRTREKGSDAGNNGIKSLNAHIGPAYARLRVGIDNDLRDKIPDADFVLSKFINDEAKMIDSVVEPKVLELIELFIRDDFTISSHS